MKVVILCGGMGMRLKEETEFKPKPMVPIGSRPILWHIMKIYSAFGFNEFIICLGYKGYMIKEYFSNYFLHQSDVTIDVKNNKIEVHNNVCEPWKITLIDTGLDTMTGGRIKRIRDYVKNETFMVTYGDGVGDINLKEVLEFHKKQGKYATLTATKLLGRFGALEINSKDEIISFQEKPKGNRAWVNSGFFVLEPQVFDYIEGDETMWEREPLEKLAKNEQLAAYKHKGFWMCMDTLRDKEVLGELWISGNLPWKTWKD